MGASVKVAPALLAAIALVAGCATSEEVVDSRVRTDTLDMRPPVGPDAVGTLTVAGRIDATAFTADALWALVAVPARYPHLDVNRVVRIDLANNRLSDLFAVGGFASGAMAAGHGAIWVAEGLGGDNVHRIDLASQRIVTSVAFPHNPTGVAVDENAVWVIASADAPRLGGILLRVRGLALFRVDPVANAIVGTISIPAPGGLTTGSVATAAGSVWVATAVGGVVRVDPRKNQIIATLPAPGEDADRRATYRLAATAQKLWLVRRIMERPCCEAMRTTVWEIDPRTNRLAPEPIQLDDGAVMFLEDDGVWLGSAAVDAIQRADPRTFRPAAGPLKIGYPVYALAAGQGTLWAFSGAKLTRGDNRNLTWITRVRTVRPTQSGGER